MTQPIAHSSKIADAAPAGATPQGMIDRGKLALIAVERTRMPMMVSDPNQPDSPIILVNAAFIQTTGYTSDELLGRNCRLLQGPETNPADVDALRIGLAAGERFTHEILNYRKDGTKFWNQLHISPIYDDDGKLLYHFASQLDVTRRREAQALEHAEHALLKEIDHRAKNALALVQGIVRLSCDDDSKAYARAVQGRVDALANAHAMLAAAGWREIALDRLLASETAPLGQSRFDVTGPPVAIPVEHVQPLTLLIHELIENAVAHGALSNSIGRLSIRWSRTIGEVAIEFAESGGPKPPPVRTPGFGLTMGAAIARRQLRGRLDFDWRDEGLHSRVVVPLEPIPA